MTLATAKTSAKFWDRIALRYSKQSVSDTNSYEKKLAATQALMQADMKVLEFGCGTGSTALIHAEHVDQVVATDISSAMLAIGREKAKHANIHNVSFERSSIEEFDGVNENFDMILALNLLHLVPDRQAALAKIHDLLKPGGIFVSSTVCLSDKMWFMRPVIAVMQWLGKAPFVNFIKANRVLLEVQSAGFKKQESWTHGVANSLFLIARKA